MITRSISKKLEVDKKTKEKLYAIFYRETFAQGSTRVTFIYYQIISIILGDDSGKIFSCLLYGFEKYSLT